MQYFSDYDVEMFATVQGQYILINNKKYKILRADNDGFYTNEVINDAKTDEK